MNKEFPQKGSFILHDIISMEALLQQISDQYQPKEQKSQKIVIIQNKCNDAKTKFKSYFKDIKDKSTRKEVDHLSIGFDAVYNHCQSILDMIENKELSKADFAEFLEKQEIRFSKLKRLISSLIKQNISKLEKVEITSEKTEGGEMKVLNNGSKETAVTMDEILRSAEPKLKHYETYKNKFPKEAIKNDKYFVILRAPIIPVLAPLLTLEQVENSGFDAEAIGKYLVFKDQLAVGMNLTKEDGPSEKDIIDTISDRTGKNWAQVGKPITDKKGWRWIWIVPEKVLNQLTSKNIHLNAREWGFAFREAD